MNNVNVEKIVLTESDGTTLDSVSTTGGFSSIVATLSDGSEVTIFPVATTNPEPSPTPETIEVPLDTPVILTAKV